MPGQNDMDFEEQDQSEVFDEDNYSLDGAGDASADFKTLEEIPDVYDVTSAVGDTDDDAAAIGEDLDDEGIADLEADADLADFEDDELAARMPEALQREGEGLDGPEDVRLEAEGDLDRIARAPVRSRDDEVELRPAGDLDNVVGDDPATLEAERLSDEEVEDLGYGKDGSFEARFDGMPGNPVRFEITLRDKMWVLSRDGRPIHEYGHAERAVHEANEIARELRRTGEPAVVYLEPKDGAWIEIVEDDDRMAADADEEDDADRDDVVEDETSAVVPDRGPNA